MTPESTFATLRTELVNLRPLRFRCKCSVSWWRWWWWWWWLWCQWWWWWGLWWLRWWWLLQRRERSWSTCVRSDIAASPLWVDVKEDDDDCDIVMGLIVILIIMIVILWSGWLSFSCRHWIHQGFEIFLDDEGDAEIMCSQSIRMIEGDLEPFLVRPINNWNINE